MVHDLVLMGRVLSMKAITFDEAADMFLTYSKENKRSYDRDVTNVKALKAFFGGMLMREITADLVERYKVERMKTITIRGTPIKSNTINREIACIKTMFSRLVKDGLLAENPLQPVRLFKSGSRDAGLDPEQFERLLTVSSPSIRIALALGYYAGLGRVEVLNLRWSEIDFTQRIITIKEDGEVVRIIPFIPFELYHMLRDFKKDAPSDYVLGMRGKPMSIGSFSKGLSFAVNAAGLEDFRFTDLYQSTKQRMLQKGIPEYLVQAVCQRTHGTSDTINLNSDAVRSILKKLND
jgi:site-specific recombinase XerD